MRVLARKLRSKCECHSSTWSQWCLSDRTKATPGWQGLLFWEAGGAHRRDLYDYIGRSLWSLGGPSKLSGTLITHTLTLVGHWVQTIYRIRPGKGLSLVNVREESNQRHQQPTLSAAGRINDSGQSRERMMSGPSISDSTHYSPFSFPSVSITFPSLHSCTHVYGLHDDAGLWSPPLSIIWLWGNQGIHRAPILSLLIPFHRAYINHLKLKHGMERRKIEKDRRETQGLFPGPELGTGFKTEFYVYECFALCVSVTL